MALNWPTFFYKKLNDFGHKRSFWLSIRLVMVGIFRLGYAVSLATFQQFNRL
jgi:hypothetical protein